MPLLIHHPSSTVTDAKKLLAHPLVLKAAWTRVEHWYRGSDLVPQPELATWKLYPESEIRKLSRDIRDGEWKPSRWLQVPYPKKGSCLRHYTLPTVRDQVAFMAHMVLLGPLLDAKTHSFVFGNRWYRPVQWDRHKKTWVNRSYPFYSKNVYLPYSRSHGLYRRVANWTVRRMLGVDFEDRNYSGVVQCPDDYQKDYLPPWVNSDWWGTSSSRSAVYWSTLDIQLAYPSVGLEELGSAIQNVLEDPTDNIRQTVSGYPYPALDAITEQAVCLEVANHLLTALRLVEFDSGTIKKDAWKPRHVNLPRNWKGLPTGLAISGLLLNVMLYPSDRKILNYLDSQDTECRSAFLRFADDMTLFSRSSSGLFELMEEVWKGISGDSNARLDYPKSTYRLFLNFAKTGPDAIRDVLNEYLRYQGWKECKERRAVNKGGNYDACEELRPPEDPRRRLDISDWWRRRSNDEKAQKQLDPYSQAIKRSAVRPDEVGPFVTTLVERLSEIGRDTLGDRFGEGADERLVQLHDLARFDIADQQVRPDTRRTFAVNRLVSAWLSSDTEEARAQLKDIRDSVAAVVQETPWKPALWRAVVRATARRPPVTDNSATSGDDATAKEWLLTQLRRIATERRGSGDSANWHRVWPEVEPQKQHTRDESWRELYLSFVRTAFWNALADTILLLQRYHHHSTNPSIADAGLSPNAWVARAVPDGNFDHVAKHLGALDQWAEALYSKDLVGTDLERFSWELDSLVTVVLASRQRLEIAQAWLHCKSPGDRLMIPESLELPKDSLVFRILEHSGRIQPRDAKSRLLGKTALANIRLGARDSSLGDFLFPPEGLSRIKNADKRPRFVLSATKSLGCSGSLDPKFIERIVPDLADLDRLIPTVRKDPLFLSEYGFARSLLLGAKEWSGSIPTLHRLLWGVPTDNRALPDWRIRAWEIPAVGLPTRVAAFLFHKLKDCDKDSEVQSVELPTTWNISAKKDSISVGRMMQFDIVGSSHTVNSVTVSVCRTNSWEIPPHPAYFLPFIMNGSSDSVNESGFTMYCDVLLFLTAMDGGESILGDIVNKGVGAVPFVDRWDWRSRIHLHADAWRDIEEVVSWAFTPHHRMGNFRASIDHSICSHAPKRLRLYDFRLERIDLLLNTQRDGEFVRSIRDTSVDNSSLQKELWLDDAQLSDSLSVRIGQIAASPCEGSILRNFPRIQFRDSNQVMEQVFRIFNSPKSSRGCRNDDSVSGQIDLIVFPEVSVPVAEISTVRQYVKRTGRSSLAGLFWRELSPVYRDSGNRGVRRRWFVNEAELVISMNYNARGPNFVRSYRVRKVLPAHIEIGFEKALSSKSKNLSWKMLKGRRWYRFVHPKWGDFSIAICADLLDPAPWRSLRGELLHLLMVAYNKDVELYESLTWIRAYENYVNLVAVNHGKYGGSFIWTPRRSHSREVATLRGSELFLFADVDLPVKDLIATQRDGVDEAVKRACRKWICGSTDSSRYKAPPPGFSRRSI